MANPRLDNDGHFVPIRSGSFAIIDNYVPEAGRDYPTDQAEFNGMFDSEGACRSAIERLRFPGGFICEACGGREVPWRSGTGLLGCKACRKPTSLTDGTIFHGSPISLVRWFRALWQMTDCESGATAASLQSILNVSNPKRASHHLKRIRAAMALGAAAKLRGSVCVASTRLDVDDSASGDGARPAVVMAIAFGAGKRPTVRMRQLKRGNSREVVGFVLANVEPGSVVHTAPWRGFAPLTHAGYKHRIEPPKAAKGAASRPDVQQVWSLLKLWLWSAPGVTDINLQSYLDDFTFRYNRRAYPRGLLFFRLMMLAVTYEQTQSEVAQLRDVG